jgi:NAD(P)-dependent dehydrogenase (short-subunit alcohol dehydrogenase family)
LKEHTSTMSKESLKETNGSVVIVGSTAGKFGEAYHADYAASKSALMYLEFIDGFMRSLKNEIVKIIPTGRVNCVAPG